MTTTIWETMRDRFVRNQFTILAALVVSALSVPGAAAAAAGKGRVGVVVLRGAGEGLVRAKVADALKANGFQVVGGQQLDSTASGLSVSLDSDAGLRAVARELNISAFVAGDLSRKKAALTVRNGADGAVLAEASFAGANPKKIAAQVGADFWRQLGPAVRLGKAPSGAKTKAAIAEEAPPAAEEGGEAAAPPPAEEKAPEPREPRKKSAKRAAEKPAEPAAEEAAEAATDKDKKAGKKTEAEPAEAQEEAGAGASSFSPAGLPAVTLGIGGRALFRRLDWNQDNQDPGRRLPPYALSPGPEAALWLEAYPAALINETFAANIGVFASFNYGFGVTSTTTDGSRLTTKFQDFMGGLKVRLPVARFAPYLSAAYGAQSFQLTPATGTSIIPSVAYKFIRLGLGTRVAFGPAVSLDLGAAFLLLTALGTQAGEIRSAAYFPRATANGVEVGASLEYRILGWLAARAGVDFRQYGLDFKVRSGDPRIVGGATDRYITAFGGLEFVLDGVGAVGGDDDDEAEPAAPAPPPPPAKGKRKKAAPAEETADTEESK